MKIPLSTYRIQFNKKFTFRDLKKTIPYLKELGIDCIYASPIFKAVPGSEHGYDQTDPHQINPEIGTITELRIIKEELRNNDIKWLQDIVPNHMAFHKENYWLMDVLEKGRESEFWRFFDINWHHPYYKGKLMAPVLNESLEEAIENKNIALKLTDHGICIDYFEHSFPASINSYKFIIESATSLNRKVLSIINRDDEIQENLDKFSENKLLIKDFLNLQNFELVPWQESNKQINYRRFFTINSLICLKMEEEVVFNYFHKFILQLVREEIFDGLRIDHIDGLLEPDIYLERLRGSVGKEIYIVVEKILEPNERLSKKWPIQGTTGYDFLANASRLLTNENNYHNLQDIYFRYTGNDKSFIKNVFRNKYNFLKKYMSGDLQNLFFILKALIPDAEINSLAAILAGMSVYRLYPDKSGLTTEEKGLLITAAQTAKENSKYEKIDNLLNVMLEGKGDDWHYFMQRFQQLSGPLAAKGIEDTTFYQYNLLISHNEVGDNTEFYNYSITNFTNFVTNRSVHSINATSTHDTKRGEDARMRINALSEFPDAWQFFLSRAEEINRRHDKNTLPDKNDLYFLYQAIIGSLTTKKIADEEYIERLTNYMIKTVREGKLNSDWESPNEKYEKILKSYINLLLKDMAFLNEIENIFSLCSFYGCLNSLSQLVLKCTLSGVVDFYQGTELWDFNFVDPDNRNLVDYTLRKNIQEEIRSSTYEEIVNKFAKDFNDPEVKFYFVNKLLHLRVKFKELFLNGSCENIEAKGKYKENVYSFRRTYQDKELIVTTGRKLSSVYGEVRIKNYKWENTEVLIQPTKEYTDIFTNKKYSGDGVHFVKDLFSYFPLSVLINN